MSSEPIVQTPGFWEEASAVMNSVYWKTPSHADPRKHVEAAMALADERDILSKALRTCTRREDLRGKAKAIYEKALATLSPR
jgi:hypothetical protein